MPASVAADEIEEEHPKHEICEVDQLQNHGINKADIDKLRANGYPTVGVGRCGPNMYILSWLMNVVARPSCRDEAAQADQRVFGDQGREDQRGLPQVIGECALHWCDALSLTRFQVSTSGWISSAELAHKRQAVFKVKTGSDALDKILGGGFESASVSEVFSEFRCGKTQLAHTMCVTAQLPRSLRGADGKVAVIDTEGTFRPERITQIAERFGGELTCTKSLPRALSCLSFLRFALWQAQAL